MWICSWDRTGLAEKKNDPDKTNANKTDLNRHLFITFLPPHFVLVPKY